MTSQKSRGGPVNIRRVELPMNVTLEQALDEWMEAMGSLAISHERKDALERRYQVIQHCDECGRDPRTVPAVSYDERLTQEEVLREARKAEAAQAALNAAVLAEEQQATVKAAEPAKAPAQLKGSEGMPRKIGKLDAEEARRAVESAKERGLIDDGKPKRRPGALDPEEIRKAVADGKERGLIFGEGSARPVAKNGEDVATAGKLRSQWMEVTPALAKLWMENNFRNRPVSEDVVAAYARDMVNGKWAATHQGLAFNDRDELIDGQHRLLAVMRSGLTVRMMVTFGLPAEIPGQEMTTMDAVDRGRTRSVADQLKIQHGFKDGWITAAICSSIAGICSQERTRRLSVGQTLDIFRAFEGPIRWVIMHRTKEHGFKSAGVLAAFAFALRAESDMTPPDADRGPVAVMFARLISGESLQEDSAMGRLRGFLTSDAAKLLTRGNDRALAELVLQAIWLEQRGKPVEKLEISDAGAAFFRGLQKERVGKVAAMFALKR